MSTILKALRKLEDEQPKSISVDATQLDRDVLEADANEGPGALGRIALVVTAVLFSGFAGAGLTLAALTVWQSRTLTAEDRSGPPAEVASAPVVREQRAEEPIVVVVADVLQQRDESFASAGLDAYPAPAHDAQPASGIAVRELAIVTSQPEDFASELDELLPEPLAFAAKEPDPVLQLAALREERMSRAPAEDQSVGAAEPVTRNAAPVRSESIPLEPEVPELETVEVAPEPARVSVVDPDPVPSLAVMHTTWHPRKQRRRAEISLLEAGETRIIELKEGDSVGPYRLSEIGPTGVTFLYKGIEIQRRVGAPRE